jgi:hypothetical protein
MHSRFEQDSILRRVDLGYSGTLRRVQDPPSVVMFCPIRLLGKREYVSHLEASPIVMIGAESLYVR